MADTSIILGNYELLEVIGDGAEGRVYKARCVAEGVAGISPGELVALKRLKSTRQDKESQQLRREVHILRKLNHPNIVRYRDSFIWREHELEEDIHCLVMELIDGEPLKARLQKQGGAMGWGEAEPIFSQILQALEYAARHGVVHRDLKPSNILITSQGQPKLIDFGIARQEDGEGTATNTAAAAARGTFDYMAPDFANMLQKGFRGDEQSDIFSFGVLAYYTLTGRLPYSPFSENPMGEYYRRWIAPERPKADFRHPIFRILQHARSCIAKCLEADRTLRFGSFAELAGEFSKVGYRRMKLGADTYEFFEWLGKGGYGEVFRARRLGDQREVAIKRLFSSGQGSRIKREAKLLQAAPHPNLVEYIDFAEVSARLGEVEYYLILEYLEGMPGASLRHRIKNSEAGLEAAETLQIFADYLDCLEHLHRHGIIHRDIKPGNLYVSWDQPPKAKIFDLGIAYDEEGTRTHGQVPGTLDFMAPELAKPSSGRGSAQSDLYSIGVTLYQALTKKLPFPPLPVNETEGWVGFFARAEKPVACAFDHAVFRKHPELVPLLQHALAPDPRDRPESAWALRAEILAIVDGWERKKSYDLSMAAGQAAFDRQDYGEAEQQVLRALTQMPRDRAAESLRLKIQQGRTQQQYELAVARARAALGSGDYAVAKREAALALKLVPGDPTASQLWSQSQPKKIKQTSAPDIEEQPTAVTMAEFDTGLTREATAETRAADPAEIAEFEKEAGEGETAHSDEEQSQQVEAQTQLTAARRGRNRAAFLWMSTTVAALLLAGCLYYEWSIHRKMPANKSGDTAAAKLERDTQAQGPEAVAAQLERGRKYAAAMVTGQQALAQSNYDLAIKQAAEALVNQPMDTKAAKLKSDAETGQKQEREAQLERGRKYAAAMAAGLQALAQTNYDLAIRQAGEALVNQPMDTKAAKLKSDAETGQKQEREAQLERGRKYAAAMAAGQQALAQANYGLAIKQAEEALVNQPMDTKAAKLKSDAETGQKQEREAQLERGRKYAAAMVTGQQALAQSNYDLAIRQAAEALVNQPMDTKAAKLKRDAEAGQQAERAAQAERDRKYEAAMAAGQRALAQTNYDLAIKQAEEASSIKSGDTAAEKLKSDAQAQEREALAAQQAANEERARMLAAKQALYPTMSKPWENSLGMKFVPVAGTKVLFGIWDVRVKDYQAYAQANPGGDRSWLNPSFTQGNDYPVVNVTWLQAKAFCEWLTQKERAEGKLSASQGYRLPLEVEWNQAVGNTTFPWGERESAPNRAGNYASSLGVDHYDYTSPVGSFKANQCGLFDMGGNVWQWCEDEYSPGSGTRVLRGASWRDSVYANLRSAYRYNCTPESRSNTFGFRVVLFDSASP